MKTNRLIMFDIDGTLLKTESEDSLYSGSMKEWLSINSIDTDWTSYKHVTDSGIAAELFLRVKGYWPTEEDINHAANIFFKKWKQKLIDDPLACVPTEGINIFLSGLQSISDITIAVATGGWEKTAKLKLNHSGISFSKAAISTSNDSFSREQIMQIAYERASKIAKISNFQNVVYFGDSEWDVIASLKLGFNFIGIDSSNRKNSLLRKGARYIFKDFGDYEQIIDLVL